MSQPFRHESRAAKTPGGPPPRPAPPDIGPLADEQETEVRAFLRRGSVDTIVMSGLIADNGLESPFNRGTFYGARDARGQLVGVALIGHATLFEARSEAALAGFARLAQKFAHTHVLVGAPDKEFEEGEPHDIKVYYPVDPKQLPKELDGVAWPP